VWAASRIFDRGEELFSFASALKRDKAAEKSFGEFRLVVVPAKGEMRRALLHRRGLALVCHSGLALYYQEDVFCEVLGVWVGRHRDECFANFGPARAGDPLAAEGECFLPRELAHEVLRFLVGVQALLALADGAVDSWQAGRAAQTRSEVMMSELHAVHAPRNVVVMRGAAPLPLFPPQMVEWDTQDTALTCEDSAAFLASVAARAAAHTLESGPPERRAPARQTRGSCVRSEEYPAGRALDYFRDFIQKHQNQFPA
jgi:hypothetical protein